MTVVIMNNYDDDDGDAQVDERKIRRRRINHAILTN
jgi:hypothetical protein